MASVGWLVRVARVAKSLRPREGLLGDAFIVGWNRYWTWLYMIGFGLGFPVTFWRTPGKRQAGNGTEIRTYFTAPGVFQVA